MSKVEDRELTDVIMRVRGLLCVIVDPIGCLKQIIHTPVLIEHAGQ